MIISREFIISGFRLIASDNGIVIAAVTGQVQTVFQMAMIIVLIAAFEGSVFGSSGTDSHLGVIDPDDRISGRLY